MKTILYFTLTLVTFVMFAFVSNSFAEESRPIVRLIYFLPNDRDPQSDIDTKMDELIRNVQQGYAEMMQDHGFGRKTFLYETDTDGKAVVHHFVGKFTNEYYTELPDSPIIMQEIRENFDMSKNFYLIVLDTSNAFVKAGDARVGGLGSHVNTYSGWALIPASGGNFGIFTTAHELGHAFGLLHDNRFNANLKINSIIYDTMITSSCAAEWLDVHRAFNPHQITMKDQKPTFEMLPLNLVAPPNTIHLRFKITDPDGIHQVQLHTQDFYVFGGFIDYKSLNGNLSDTVEFATTYLTPANEWVSLRVIDVHGNYIWTPRFTINITDFLPPPEVVSIPDANLAVVIEKEIGNPITTHTILKLVRLRVVGGDQQIKDLTGLEHAHSLRELILLDNTKLDLSQIAQLTQLRSLYLVNNAISDLSQIAQLTQLTELSVVDNAISDVTPLTQLTELISLWLPSNVISDITPLAELTQLRQLRLGGNDILNISPLAQLTQLTDLGLNYNTISDVSPLAGLVNLSTLDLRGNPIQDREPLLTLLRKNPDLKIFLKASKNRCQ